MKVACEIVNCETWKKFMIQVTNFQYVDKMDEIRYGKKYNFSGLMFAM